MKERYHGLDLARAVFMVMGILFHTSLIYREDREWRVFVTDGHSSFIVLCDVLSAFRMPAFFIIAGFFFLYIAQKYDVRYILKDRIIKLGVPVITVGMTFNYIMVALSSDSYSSTSGWQYIFSTDWVAHLWFILTLLLYTLGSIPLTYLFSKNEFPILNRST